VRQERKRCKESIGDDFKDDGKGVAEGFRGIGRKRCFNQLNSFYKDLKTNCLRLIVIARPEPVVSIYEHRFLPSNIAFS
jgi:hypothetical protein